MPGRGLLERLSVDGRPVVGDGSFAYVLEKRTYVKAGVYTPEVVVEHPEAGKVVLINWFEGLKA